MKSKSPKKKPTRPKRILRLPDLDHAKVAVLNTLSSPDSHRSYRFAIDDFISWYCSEPRLPLNKAVVLRCKLQLEARHLASSTINLRLAAVRRLAYEAADTGLLSPELAAGIRRVKGAKKPIVDLAEGVLKVVEAVDIVLWPVALDFKRSDVEAMPDASIDVSFVNGAIRLSEQETMAKLVRRKSKMVIAYGACAYQGGIPGLANLTDKEAILDYVYRQAPSNSDGAATRPQQHTRVPEGELDLPEFYDMVKALDDVIDVDYYIPGCPPTPKITLRAIEAILQGRLPEKGAVLAGDRALCYECDLNSTSTHSGAGTRERIAEG
jgi:coenzyme F420-reducing hydrogenase gamma subunit